MTETLRFFQDGLTGSAWGDWALYTDSPLRSGLRSPGYNTLPEWEKPKNGGSLRCSVAVAAFVASLLFQNLSFCCDAVEMMLKDSGWTLRHCHTAPVDSFSLVSLVSSGARIAMLRLRRPCGWSGTPRLLGPPWSFQRQGCGGLQEAGDL